MLAFCWAFVRGDFVLTCSGSDNWHLGLQLSLVRELCDCVV